MKRTTTVVAATIGVMLLGHSPIALAEAPAEGSDAPNFTLGILNSDPSEVFELARYKGNKPVVLIFGSYT